MDPQLTYLLAGTRKSTVHLDSYTSCLNNTFKLSLSLYTMVIQSNYYPGSSIHPVTGTRPRLLPCQPRNGTSSKSGCTLSPVPIHWSQSSDHRTRAADTVAWPSLSSPASGLTATMPRTGRVAGEGQAGPHFGKHKGSVDPVSILNTTGKLPYR